MLGPMTLEKLPLWAAMRDTHGLALPSRHPIGTLIGSYPELRSLSVGELASSLAVSEIDAQLGVAALALDAFGDRATITPGASFDAATMHNGAPAAPVWMLPGGGGSGYVTSGVPSVRSETEGLSEAAGPWNDSTFAPLGASYQIGQNRLHQPIDPDPNDPDMPNAVDLPAFCAAVGTQQFGGAPLDPVADREFIKACFRSFRNYGPIREDNSVSIEDMGKFWWTIDWPNLGDFRSVFWYEFDRKNGDDPGQLMMQISAADTRTYTPAGASVRVVPQANGEQALVWHYRGNGEWKHLLDFSQWWKENWRQILSDAAVIAAVVATVCTACVAGPALLGVAGAAVASTAGPVAGGLAAAAVPAGTGIAASITGAIAGAIGVTPAALAAALGSVAGAATAVNLGIGCAIAIADGDGSAILKSVSAFWGQVQQYAPAPVKDFLAGAASDGSRAVGDFLKPLSNAWANVRKQAESGFGASLPDLSDLQPVLSQVQRLAAWPVITQKYVDDAAKVMGPTGAFFFNAAQGKSLEDVIAGASEVPAYAVQFYTAGAIVNQVRLEQEALALREFKKKQAYLPALSKPSLQQLGRQLVRVRSGDGVIGGVAAQSVAPASSSGGSAPAIASGGGLGSAPILLGVAAAAWFLLRK